MKLNYMSDARKAANDNTRKNANGSFPDISNIFSFFHNAESQLPLCAEHMKYKTLQGNRKRRIWTSDLAESSTLFSDGFGINK